MLQLKVHRFPVGSYLVVEGKDDNDHFYIIQQGNVQCLKSLGSGTQKFVLGPGDFVGVVPCMASRAQIETAIAMTEVTVIAVKKEQYPDLIVNNTQVALKIIKTFAARMRQMNEMLTKATLNTVAADSNEQIFSVAYFYEKSSHLNVALFAYYQYLKTKPTSDKANIAKQRFVALKPKTHAVYLESNQDLVREYPEDTMIFSEAQTGADMFIIQEGEVGITKVVNNNEVTLAVLKKGDMFGEMALLENKPRSACAIARTNCKLMVINHSNFNQMVSTQPQLIARLTTTLAERLWSMYRQLDNANLADPLQKMIDMLSLQMEKQRTHFRTTDKTEQTKLTPKDLATMCGIPQNQQAAAIYSISNDFHIKIIDGYIFIKDVNELVKQAAFYRKQNAQNSK